MWRPDEVIPQHRRRAVLVWVLLIAVILSYSALMLYRDVEKRKHPNTTFAISDEVYEYPDLWVCLYGTYGCDDQESEEQCVESIFDTEGGSTTARYRPGDTDEEDISITAELTDEHGWCVVFETSALDYNLGEDRDADDYIDYTRVDMYWYPGGSDNNSTTCIQEESEWTSHKENIFAFLNDPATGEVSAGVQIPYSCMTSESTSHYFTYVGIGVTKEIKISGKETGSFNALTISTVEHKDERTANITGIQAPFAYLSLQLQQESNSLIVITEIDPLDLAEIFGEIGGFWDLILIAWPIFFVAISYEPPHLKPRNFRESAARVTETATKVLPTNLHGLTRSETERHTLRITPTLDRETTTSHHQENGIHVRLFESHGLVAVLNASSRVAKFLQTEFGARYLRRGGEEAALKNLLPPKTHLIKVPTNATAVSIAATIAGYYNSEGGSEQANAGPIALKVTRVSCTVLQSQALAASSYVSADDEIIDETVVDLGEDIVNPMIPSPNIGGEARQREEQQWIPQRRASFRSPQAPKGIISPPHRSFSNHSAQLTGNIDTHIGARRSESSPPGL